MDNIVTMSRLKSLEKSCEEYSQELYKLNTLKNREVDENQGLRAQIAVLEGRLDLKNQTLETIERDYVVTSTRLATLESSSDLLYSEEVMRLSIAKDREVEENQRLRAQITVLENTLKNIKS